MLRLLNAYPHRLIGYKERLIGYKEREVANELSTLTQPRQPKGSSLFVKGL